jgi:hypothetical protein
MTSVKTEIRTEQLPNTSLKYYRYANPLDPAISCRDLGQDRFLPSASK